MTGTPGPPNLIFFRQVISFLTNYRKENLQHEMGLSEHKNPLSLVTILCLYNSQELSQKICTSLFSKSLHFNINHWKYRNTNDQQATTVYLNIAAPNVQSEYISKPPKQ